MGRACGADDKKTYAALRAFFNVGGELFVGQSISDPPPREMGAHRDTVAKRHIFESEGAKQVGEFVMLC